MLPFSKRKRCLSCNESFHSAAYLKRHRCSAEDTRDCDETETVDDQADNFSSHSDDDDEEVYMDEADIEEMMRTFKPNQRRGEETTENPSFLKTLLLWTCLFLCLWQSVFYISSSAMAVLLQYIHAALTLAAKHYKFASCLLPLFPSTIYMLHKLLKLNLNNFTHFVVCPSCFKLYNYEDCIQTIEGEEVTRTCSFVAHPNHPQAHRRVGCGSNLLKTVYLPSGRKRLFPFKNYYYKPVKQSLKELISKKGFEELCEQWRHRNTDDTVMSDVYDGEIWKTFTPSFLNKPHNYGLMLNLDWFQPYQHVKYSVGVMYLVLLNLPRHERFKRENIILVSIIPHMKKEPPTNTFVKPLVDELQEAWTVGFSYPGLTTSIFHLALLCIGCDIPACRKLCGFLGHAAAQGCSRCKKTFAGGFGCRDYSGFDRTTWTNRSHDQHVREIRHITKMKTKTTKEELESKYGTRYSVLSELPYIDLIKMSVVDPMHNLFLGTAKHMLHIWKDTGVLAEKDFDMIQKKVDDVECPSDIGRIPMKIASGFASFNADQFKNWTLLFSIYALKDVIGDSHLECWRLFVLACRLLCCRTITLTDINLADQLLSRFCISFEKLYGKERVTPNMHLHLHLHECVKDFGPIYSFWLFSFERCNGIMGDIPTNNKNIEMQLMRRFLCHSQLLSTTFKDDFGVADAINPIIEQLTVGAKSGTLATIETFDDIYLRRMASRLTEPTSVEWVLDGLYKYSTFKVVGLSAIEHTWLADMYKFLYGCDVSVMPAAKQIKTVTLSKQVLGSAKSPSSRSSHIMAYWTGDEGEISWTVRPRPGQIIRYLLHTAVVDDELKTHLLAEVRWLKSLPENARDYYGRPYEAWHPEAIVDRGPSSFMPVQRIKCKCVRVHGNVGRKKVLLVCPRDKYVSM